MKPGLNFTYFASLLVVAGTGVACSDDDLPTTVRAAPSSSTKPLNPGNDAAAADAATVKLPEEAGVGEVEPDAGEARDAGAPEAEPDAGDDFDAGAPEGEPDAGDVGDAGPTVPSVTVADGWASVWAGEPARVTNGGSEADPDHIFRVTNRTQLVRALYPDAVIGEDGTFSTAEGADPTPKIIYIEGSISLSTNAAGEERTLEDYACDGYDFEAYKAAYDPKEWNKQELVGNDPPEILPCPGTQEALRDCSSDQQQAVVMVRVGSNTTIVGVGDDAEIIHGGLIVGGGSFPPRSSPPPVDPPLTAKLAEACGLELPQPDPDPDPNPETTPPPSPPYVENVIIRNITFEDAFDYFPGWEPDDSYNTPPAVADPDDPVHPQCQAAFDSATDNGPHHCRGGRWNARYDNLRVQNAAHVWVDHCTFNDGDRETQSIPSVWEFPYNEYANRIQPHDGLLDIVNASDFVTVSYSRFLNHDKVMLIGSSNTVSEKNGWGALSVTLHHNQFINNGQRTPRARFGKVHVYSNFIQGSRASSVNEPGIEKPRPPYPMGSAMNVGHLAKFYSEANLFEVAGYPGEPPPTDLNIVTTAHNATPTSGLAVDELTYFFDSGSFLNGAPTALNVAVQLSAGGRKRPALPSTQTIWKPADDYAYEVTPAQELKNHLHANAGSGVIEVSAP